MNIVHSKKRFIKKRKSNSGFTLIELLATLSILSLVSVVIIYTTVNVINNVKDNSYMVTINNIEKESGTYVLENDKNIVWIDDGASLYQCVTVQNLIDMGYFSNDILDSKVSEDRNVKANDYIYIEKDKDTKTITKHVLLYDESSELKGLCGNYINSDGVINIDVPSGWAKSKDITITYKLADSISVGDSTNYKYDYMYDALNDNSLDISYESFGFTTLRTASKKITVLDEGTLYANIKKLSDVIVFPINVEVSKIDTLGPSITDSASNQTVRGNATIPINISDSESGVDGSTISLDDFKVSIGGNVLTSGVTLTEVNHDTDGEEINYYNYNIIISNRDYAGEVVINVDKDKISDKLGNKNEVIVLNTGVIFRNTYTISYDSNGGSGCSGSKTVVYNTNIGDLCKPTREGYTFIGWFDSSYKNTPLNYYADTYSDLKNAFGYDVSSLWNHYLTYGKNENRRISQYISSDVFKSEDDITIYAGWKANTYTIKYNANGGSGSMANTICTYDSDCKLSTNTFTRTGYTYDNWNTKSDGSGISYTNGQTVRNLTSVDGYVITLYAQWIANTYSIDYSYNGGEKGSSAPSSGTYCGGVDCGVVKIDNPTKEVTVIGDENGTGAKIENVTDKHEQTFAGWTYSNGDTNTALYGTTFDSVDSKWSNASTKVTAKYFKNLRSTSGIITLTANWTPVEFNLPTVSKKGYTCKWNTKSDGSGTSYDSGASYTPSANSSSSITMYARCNINSYYFDLNWTLDGVNFTGTDDTLAGLKINGVDQGYIKDYYKQIDYGSTWEIYGIKLNGTNISYTANGTVGSSNSSHTISLNTLIIGVNNASYGSVSKTSLYVKNGTSYSVDGAILNLDDRRSVTASIKSVTGYTTKFNGWSSSSGTITSAMTINANFTASDDIKPIIKVNTYYSNDTEYSGAWTNSNITAKVEFSDSGSGIDVNSLVWTCNNSWNAIENDSIVSYSDVWKSERNSSICKYKICDKNGNCAETSNFTIKIDKTAPTLELTNNSDGNWTNDVVYVKLDYSDSGSGIDPATLAWAIDGGSYTKFSNTNTATYTDSWGSSWWGDRVANYKVCDNAGNCTENTTPVKKGIYAVSYDANGGSGAPEGQLKYYGNDLNLSTEKPTRSNHTFLGWSTDKNATSATYEAGAKYSSNDALVLYAVWKMNTKCYKVTLDVGVACNKKPGKGGTYDNPMIVGVPNGWYMTVIDTETLSNGEIWYHVIKIANSSQEQIHDCYAYGGFSYQPKAKEYTELNGACPTPSGSGGTSSGGGSSSSGGGIMTCTEICSKTGLPKAFSGTTSCYCCSVGTKDPQKLEGSQVCTVISR